MKITSQSKILLSTALAVFSLLSPPSFAGEYYKWVDANGVSHFSERPPQETPAEKVKTHARTPTVEEDQAATVATDKELAPTTSTLEDPERCATEKARLGQLTSGSRIRMQNADGSFYYLEQKQIDLEIQKSRQAVSESCK